MIHAKAYKEMKPILDTVSKTFVEKGAYGTTRYINTGDANYYNNVALGYPDASINEKLIQKLDIDGLIAVTIDLDFDLNSEGLNPKIKIVAFAPNVSYKSAGKYFELIANTKAKPFKDANKYNSLNGGPEDVIYNVMKADAFFDGFSMAIDNIREGEKTMPSYKRLWENRTKRK